jgi:hypothetical protein
MTSLILVWEEEGKKKTPKIKNTRQASKGKLEILPVKKMNGPNLVSLLQHKWLCQFFA